MSEELMVDGKPVTEEELEFVSEWGGRDHPSVRGNDRAREWLKSGHIIAIWALRLHRTLAGLRADVDCLLSVVRAVAPGDDDRRARNVAENAACSVDGCPNRSTRYERHGGVGAFFCDDHGRAPAGPEPPATEKPEPVVQVPPTQEQMRLIIANLDYQAEFLFVDGHEDEDEKEACRVGAAYLRAGCPRPDLEQTIRELLERLKTSRDLCSKVANEKREAMDRIAELEAPQATIDLNAWLRKQSETSPVHIQKAMIDVANYLSVSGKWNVTVPYAPGTLDAVVSELAADHGKMVDDGGDSYFGKDLQAAARAALDAAKEASRQ